MACAEERPLYLQKQTKKGLFLTILILYSAASAAELLPLVVRATLVAYIAAKDGQQSTKSRLLETALFF